MASSLMHIIMNYLKISRKPPCFVTIYITTDYILQNLIHRTKGPDSSRTGILFSRDLHSEKGYSLTASPFSFRIVSVS